MKARYVLVIIALGGLAVACNQEDAVSDAATCVRAPEDGLQPAAKNSSGWDANGRSLDGIAQRGGWDGNGTALAGVELSGFASAPAVDAAVGSKLRAVLRDGRAIDLVVGAREAGEYRLEHEGKSLCAPGETGIFVPGVWDASGARHDRLEVGGETVSVTFSCAHGAIAKCVAWGYAPDTAGADLHQACTRMVRADYCGTGISFTKDGTLIDVFDDRGIQTASGSTELDFEAGWGPNGATCVRRPRFDDRTPSGARVLPSCWKDLPECTSMAAARSSGALVANASRPELRTVCR